MIKNRMCKQGLGLGTLAVLLALTAPARAQRPIGESGEALTRGPLHEAFATPVVFNPAAGPIVPKAPPGPIEELPPDQKPRGDNVEWMPGYWQYDEDRQDYLWVSGIWRVMPPGRQWVPGYWQNVAGGFQWVSGYWAPIEQQNVDYLPPPPPSLEAGPNVPPPALQGFVWTPGHWFWVENRYVWRPGLWVQTSPDWIWIPASYAYTPGGCVFVPGYWDHAVANRGMIFAPVYFSQPVYTQPAFVYTPSISISVALLTSSFFARPVCHHYYFGDYYANNYRAAGYEPWFQMERSRVAYDPIYAWSAATNAPRDPNWSVQIRESYTYRVQNVNARPERTFLAQERMIERHREAGFREQALARPFAQEIRAENNALRVERIDQARRVQFAQREQKLGELRDLRARHEAVEHARLTNASEPKAFAPRRVELPRSPISASAHFPSGGGEAFERRHEAAEVRGRQEAARAALVEPQRNGQAPLIRQADQAKQQRQELLQHEHSAAVSERFHQQEQSKAAEAARFQAARQQRELSLHGHAATPAAGTQLMRPATDGQGRPTPLPPRANPAHTHMPQSPPPPPPHDHPAPEKGRNKTASHEHNK